MRKYSPLIFCVLVLAGCNAGSMVHDQYDPKTGQLSRTVYSKYYDAGDWIIPHHLGMSVVVDHEKTEIPVLHGIQQSIGALGPSDSYARGKITVYIWNRDPEKHHVKIVRVSATRSLDDSPNNFVEPQGKEFIGITGERTGGEIGYIDIFNYGTAIPLKVEYEINGKPAAMELTLVRRTDEEIRRYFGPGGTPPYPWYHDSEKKG